MVGAERLALFPLGTVLLPGAQLGLHVFEPRYRQLVRDLLDGVLPTGTGSGPADDAGTGSGPAGQRSAPCGFGVLGISRGQEVGSAIPELASVGCLARVCQVTPFADGRYELVTVGAARFAVEQVFPHDAPYLTARVRWLPELVGDRAVARAGAAAARRLLPVYHALLAGTVVPTPPPGGAAPPGADAGCDDESLLVASWAVARALVVTRAEQQELLQAPDAASRLSRAVSLLRRECVLLRTLSAVPTFRPSGPVSDN